MIKSSPFLHFRCNELGDSKTAVCHFAFVLVLINCDFFLKMLRTVRLLRGIRWTGVPRSSVTHRLPRITTILPGITQNETNLSSGTRSTRNYSQKVHTPPEESLLDLKLYDNVCTDTLEELNDYFEEILENTNCLDSVPDILYSVGFDANGRRTRF